MLLKLGSKGSKVRQWQRWLNARLGKGTVREDGDFGPATEAATKKWQGFAGLTPDGVVGPATIAKAVSLGFTYAKPAVKPPPGFIAEELLVPIYDPRDSSKVVGRLAPLAALRWNRAAKDALEDGVLLLPISFHDTYRPPSVYETPEAKRKIALGILAKPGRSKHNLGVAIDVRDTKGAYWWLRNNGHRYGIWWGERKDEEWHWRLDGKADIRELN